MRMLRIVRVTVKDGVGELCFIVLYFVCGSLSGYLHSTSTSILPVPPFYQYLHSTSTSILPVPPFYQYLSNRRPPMHKQRHLYNSPSGAPVSRAVNIDPGISQGCITQRQRRSEYGVAPALSHGGPRTCFPKLLP
jgi:hypothetical protein